MQPPPCVIASHSAMGRRPSKTVWRRDVGGGSRAPEGKGLKFGLPWMREAVESTGRPKEARKKVEGSRGRKRQVEHGSK